MAALLRPIGEPVHRAVLAGGKELAQPGAGFGRERSGREADRIEAEFERAGADGRSESVIHRLHR
jgi:hypothetical protein